MPENNLKLSKDHQRLVLAGLMQQGYILSAASKDMNDSYFTDSSCRIIYKSLVEYYDEFSKLPTEAELSVLVESNYIPIGDSLETVKDNLHQLMSYEPIDEDFLLEKCTELIKKVRVSRALQRNLEKIKNGTALNDNRILNDLINSLDVSYSRSGILCLSDTDGLMEARKEAVGNSSNEVIKSILHSINESLQYRGYQKGTMNLIVAPPGTGKTSYLVNEGAYAALQGYNVLHVFLGDMIQYDGFVRYISSISGELQDTIVAMSSEDQQNLIAKVNEDYNGVLQRISVLSYGSGEVTVDQLIENVNKEQDRLGIVFDDIIIDYADNFLKDNTALYSEGGYIYDRLALYGRVNHSVIMVASQPKIQYWRDEIIPLEGASESSKKQHIVDLLMTFNLVNRNATIGTFFVPKVRRGISGKLIRVRTEWERCRIAEITEQDYTNLKSEMSL